MAVMAQPSPILTEEYTGDSGDSKVFVCEYDGCDYSGRIASNLRRHKWVHTGKKPFACCYDGCTFATSDPSNLKTHRRTHTGEKPFKCELCDYATSHSSHLTRHKRTHENANSKQQDAFENTIQPPVKKSKPFTCEFGCGYSCARKSTVLTHQRVHTGETPYVCSWEGCGYSSKFLSNFRRHQRKHRGSNDDAGGKDRTRAGPTMRWRGGSAWPVGRGTALDDVAAAAAAASSHGIGSQPFLFTPLIQTSTAADKIGMNPRSAFEVVIPNVTCYARRELPDRPHRLPSPELLLPSVGNGVRPPWGGDSAFASK